VRNGFLWADVAGLTLTSEDKEILSHPFISGLILFSRNYESKEQLRELTRQIKSVSPEIIITVDQEGGRVQRFREGFTELPAMGELGAQFVKNPIEAKKEITKTLSTMVNELRDVGIYSSLVPVLDIDYGRSEIIGHRSFGANANHVNQVAEFAIDQWHQLKMPVTGKHFPGHGFVTVDSHLDLPIDNRSFDEIEKQDLQPFSYLSKKLDAIMLAHVVYEQIDSEPVLFSYEWIQEILRKQLQYDGLIMCDDLSMHAVSKMGSYFDRAERALEAGCDVLLVCNSRDGVVDILDHVSSQKNDDSVSRLNRYKRYQ